MSTPPKVFVSAASGDLRSARQAATKALLTIGCHPVEQTHFGPDYRRVRDMLRGRIEECQALIHIVGLRYGTEPDPAALPAGQPRRSYTQMEYDIGCELQARRGGERFRVYAFVCPADFPYDLEPDADDDGKRALQAVHRQAILSCETLYETPADNAALEARILALREEAHRLRAERDRRERWFLAVGLAIVFALVAIGAGVWWFGPHRTGQEVVKSIDPAMVAERLRMEIQQRYERDAETAHREGKHWETLRELEKNRDLALSRVDEIVTTIREGLAGNPDPIFREAGRILEQEGSEAALGYLESHRADLLARADRAAGQAEAAEEKLRQSLQPLVLQADLLETRQQWDAALNISRIVAEKAPHWWEARLRLGTSLYTLARYDEAEPHLRAVLALAADQKDLATGLNNLAQLLQATNRLAEAEPLMGRALAIDEKSYGPEHPDVARDLNNLALLLLATNRLAEAEPLMRRALAIGEKRLGPEHPDVAIRLNNLAQLLQATNRLVEAEPLMLRALAIGERTYGPEHPEVAIRLSNLARLLYDTSRMAEAEPLMRRTLAIAEKSYGPEHPKVAIRLNNLAQLLQATNRLVEAEPLMRRALAIDEKSYGPEHPDVARDLNNLALLLQATNRLAEAEPLMRRTLATAEKSYGPEHPDVAIALNNLASLLYSTNRLAEAEPLMRRTLAIDEKSYGPEHPKVAIRFNNLAQLLTATNRLAEAEPLMRRALAIDEKSLGPEHPDVAIALNNFALLLKATDRLAEAEALMRRALLILLKSTRAAGHELPGLRKIFGDYQIFLTARRLKPPAIAERLDSLGPEAGYPSEEWQRLRGGWAEAGR